MNMAYNNPLRIKNFVIFLFLLFTILIISCNSGTSVEVTAAPEVQETVEIINGEPELETEQDTENIDNSVNPIADEIQYTTDGVAYLVHPDKILSGGPSKGGIGVDRGIPALSDENINFVSVTEADEWIEDNELVLVLNYNGEKRVYPLQILVWHEIANDEVAGVPLAITYCPLCGSGIAYERTLTIESEEQVVEFGTSGKLYNSNLVMYDDATDTYWQQIDGKAILGDLVGQELIDVSIDTVVWRDYKGVYSDAQVLSQDTGMSRSYGTDPYGSYYEDSLLFFSVDNEDDSIHPKTVVFGIEIEGTYKAYLEDDVIAAGLIVDSIGTTSLEISRDEVGLVSIINSDTGDEIVKERDFWFAWYAFHPNTEVYGR
tara:strand:- start:11630 stop:12751 length:1122 start_codon:yes stop_codon:yes gene_type:complete